MAGRWSEMTLLARAIWCFKLHKGRKRKEKINMKERDKERWWVEGEGESVFEKLQRVFLWCNTHTHTNTSTISTYSQWAQHI